MAETFRADPTALARLAAATLAASTGLSDAWDSHRPELAVPAAAFGNTPASPASARSHAAATDAGELAIDRVTGVCDGDVDRLYRAAFAYEQADRAAAAAAAAARRPGGGRVIAQ